MSIANVVGNLSMLKKSVILFVRGFDGEYIIRIKNTWILAWFYAIQILRSDSWD